SVLRVLHRHHARGGERRPVARVGLGTARRRRADDRALPAERRDLRSDHRAVLTHPGRHGVQESAGMRNAVAWAVLGLSTALWAAGWARATAPPSPPPPPPRATATAEPVKVTILSTMLADKGIGEWGFAALVEVGGRPILFDTGAHPDVVLRNAAEMKIDLAP